MSKRSRLRNEDTFALGNWKINPALCIATHDQTDHELSVKMSEVISYLAKNADRTVTRAELIEEFWEGNFTVGEKSLTNTVWQLRKVLEDDPNKPNYIQTVHRSGYKLLQKPIYAHPEQSTEPDHTHKQDAIKKTYSKHIIIVLASVIFTLSLVIGFNNTPSIVEAPVSKQVNITDFPGRELNHALSSDGQTIAFRWIPLNEVSNIYLKSLKNPSTPLKQLTFTDVEEYNPTWSEDDAHLAYTRKSKQSQCTIYLLNMKSLVERPLGACASYTPLKWSPDGKWLAYTGKGENAQNPGIYLKNMKMLFESPNTVTQDIRVSCDNCQYQDTDVSWSPDSQFLAVTRKLDSLSKSIHIYTLKDKTFSQLTKNLISIRGHAWSQDQQHILFVDDPNISNRFLYQINIKTKIKKNLGIRNAGFPVYSPDYKELYYYVRQKDNAVSYFNLAILGKGSPFPIIQTSHDEYFGDYSDDLDKIVYMSERSGHSELWLSDTKGSGNKQLTQLKQGINYPSWSNNGKFIAFLSIEKASQRNSLFILDIDSLKIKKITTSLLNYGAPTWTNNDEALLVPITTKNQSNIWVVPLDGSKPTQLTQNGGDYARHSRDGKFLYFHKSKMIYRQPFPHGQEEPIIDNTSISWGNWDISNHNIYFIDHHASHDTIEYYEAKSRNKSVIASIPNRLVSSSDTIRYVPEKNIILFTQREPQQIDIMKSPNPLIPDD